MSNVSRIKSFHEWYKRNFSKPCCKANNIPIIGSIFIQIRLWGHLITGINEKKCTIEKVIFTI